MKIASAKVVVKRKRKPLKASVKKKLRSLLIGVSSGADVPKMKPGSFRQAKKRKSSSPTKYTDPMKYKK